MVATKINPSVVRGLRMLRVVRGNGGLKLCYHVIISILSSIRSSHQNLTWRSEWDSSKAVCPMLYPLTPSWLCLCLWNLSLLFRAWFASDLLAVFRLFFELHLSFPGTCVLLLSTLGVIPSNPPLFCHMLHGVRFYFLYSSSLGVKSSHLMSTILERNSPLVGAFGMSKRSIVVSQSTCAVPFSTSIY